MPPLGSIQELALLCPSLFHSASLHLPRRFRGFQLVCLVSLIPHLGIGSSCAFVLGSAAPHFCCRPSLVRLTRRNLVSMLPCQCFTHRPFVSHALEISFSALFLTAGANPPAPSCVILTFLCCACGGVLLQALSWCMRSFFETIQKPIMLPKLVKLGKGGASSTLAFSKRPLLTQNLKPDESALGMCNRL